MFEEPGDGVSGAKNGASAFIEKRKPDYSRFRGGRKAEE
jgi:1,4-dihydroxy-2-naphthoyl-CoA synthase